MRIPMDEDVPRHLFEAVDGESTKSAAPEPNPHGLRIISAALLKQVPPGLEWLIHQVFEAGYEAGKTRGDQEAKR